MLLVAEPLITVAPSRCYRELLLVLVTNSGWNPLLVCVLPGVTCSNTGYPRRGYPIVLSVTPGNNLWIRCG